MPLSFTDDYLKAEDSDHAMHDASDHCFVFTIPFAVAQDLPGNATHAVPTPEVAPVANVPSAYDPPTFYPAAGGQPYSSLTSYMMCHDNCKNFWAGYSAERAARAAKLCQNAAMVIVTRGMGA